MKKIVIGVISSFLVMFLIWTMMLWIQEPNFIENSSHYHLDLYQMFSRFSIGADNTINFTDHFKSFIEMMKKINLSNPLVQALMNNFTNGALNVSNGFLVVVQLLNALINPLLAIGNSIIVLGYLMVLVIDFLIITTALATALFDFVFSPVFIYV